MNRRFRLTSSKDFKRVRREGRSFAHPLAVLIADPNHVGITRIGVAAGKRMGNAVQRNRAKRRLREAARALHRGLESGWDLLLLARPPLLDARGAEVSDAIHTLAAQAGLLKELANGPS